MKYEIGDVVLDSWAMGTPSKATIVDVQKSLFGYKYYVRWRNAYDSPYPRSKRHLTLVERQADIQRKMVEETPRQKFEFDTEELMRLKSRQIENQRRLASEIAQRRLYAARANKLRGNDEWFDIVVTREVGTNISVGDIGRAMLKVDGNYRLDFGKYEYHLSPRLFHASFKKYSIDDYATEYLRKESRERKKEAKKVGGELFGYPPEEVTIDVARMHEIASKKVVEAEAKVAELERQLEVARREKVAEEFGSVAERHLWDVVVDVPMSWVGSLAQRDNKQSAEVLTEGRNMVEAAIAAEAMAKGIHEDTHVLRVTYNRILGAVK